jgi:hypothetical protein
VRTVKTWVICALVAVGCLIIGALEDGPVQEQLAADEVKTAQKQERVEAAQEKKQLQVRQIYAAHLLALDRIK